MKTKLLIGALAVIYGACQSPSPHDTPPDRYPAQATVVKVLDDEVVRGEYLVKMIGCDHCHTPKRMTDRGPVPDQSRWLMGHPADSPLADYDPETAKKYVLMHPDLTAAVGPWGISYAANLTPHESGIGNWTYAHFERSMRRQAQGPG